MSRGRAERQASGTFVKFGQPHCHAHSKRLHRTQGVAEQERLECIRKGQHDPGLEIYACGAAAGWHLGHPGGWRSFGRAFTDPEVAQPAKGTHEPLRRLVAQRRGDKGRRPLTPVPDREPTEPCTRLDGALRVTYLPEVPWGSLRVLCWALAFALVAWGLGELIGIARWLVWLVSEYGRWFVPIVNGRGV